MFNNEFLIFQKFAKYYLGTSERKKSEVGKCLDIIKILILH